MKNKSIILSLLFIVLINCGYQPIYVAKKNNFKIESIEIIKKDRLNSLIKNELKNISNKESINKIDLIIDSSKEIIISSKDTKGNAEILTMTVLVNLKIIEEKKIKAEKVFTKKFSYSNNSNKFSLNQYQKDIEKNLRDKIIENIVTYLLTK
jgi:hypothetical protein